MAASRPKMNKTVFCECSHCPIAIDNGKARALFKLPYRVATVAEVVAAFGFCESVETMSDGAFELVNHARCGTAEHSLELGEGQFDRIEVWTVGWQINELCADRFDGLAYAGNFVGRQVIHDHRVSGAKRGHQLLLDIGAEDGSVNWPIDD